MASTKQESVREKYADRLKYSDKLSALSCSLDGYDLSNRLGYRWILLPIETQANHEPRAKVVRAHESKCTGWALSYFDTHEAAEARLRLLCENQENLKKVFGEHTCKTQLDSTHGVSAPSGPDGHFNHHEFHGYDLAKMVLEIKPMSLS